MCLIWVWFNFVNYESWSSNAWGDDIGIVTVMSLPSSWWRDQSICTGFASFILQFVIWRYECTCNIEISKVIVEMQVYSAVKLIWN